MDYKEIECRNEKIILKAKEYMSIISDFEHDINHMYDVVYYTKELLENLDIEKNKEVCIISAYWHDVGRTKADEGHEKISAEMLKKEMTLHGYDENLINQCYKAIEKHKWNMIPEIVEGLILKDADKLAWIGSGRWKSCLENGQKLDQKGILEFSEVTVDESTGMVNVRVRVPNSSNYLLPGMYVRANVNQGTQKDSLLVPQISIIRLNNGTSMVYTISPENTVVQKIVTISGEIDHDYIISDGLNKDDKII